MEEALDLKDKDIHDLQKEIQSCQIDYNQIVTSMKEIEHLYERKQQEIEDVKKEFEQRIQILQKHAEEAITFYKNEMSRKLRLNS